MRAYRGRQTDLVWNHIEQEEKNLLSHPGPKIDKYDELVREVAELAYQNKDVLLFYRGQAQDHKNKSNKSTFYPTIYREDRLTKSKIYEKFEILKACSSQLVESFERFEKQGKYDLIKRKYVQWSILQHYEVCDTPLLDFTQSLRVACSFAFHECNDEYAHFYVFGLPYITNRISINSEHDLINIRLLSISPPDALRPYFQEGYLAGTDEITTEYSNKTELDFNKTCIAKYRIKNDMKHFWGEEFSKIPDGLLYPENDDIKKICDEISFDSQSYDPSNLIGEFVIEWNELESQIRDQLNNDYPTPTIRLLNKYIENYNPPTVFKENYHHLRNLRNEIVHRPKKVSNNEIHNGLSLLQELRQAL